MVLLIGGTAVGGFWFTSRNSSTTTTIIATPTAQVPKPFFGTCEAAKQRAERGEEPLVKFAPKEDPCKDYK